MDGLSLIAWVITGVITGLLASRVKKGTSLVSNAMIGLIGGLIGGFIFNGLDIGGRVTGLNLASLVVAFIGAIILLGIYNTFNKQRPIPTSPSISSPKYVEEKPRVQPPPVSQYTSLEKAPEIQSEPLITQTAVPENNEIFLSYSRKDTEIMRQLREDMRTAGFTVWLDAEKLEPGTPAWELAVGNAIRSSTCLVIILSPDSATSTWVGRELALAETLEKRIFPILVRGTNQDAIPFRLVSHQYIDARKDYNAALENLLSVLRRHLHHN